MGVMDLDRINNWCKPLSEESPSGLNLEYDPRFQELLRAAEGTREQQYGKTLVAAKPPEWNHLTQLASELADETHDLRVGVLLVEGAANSDGLSGFADTLELLRSWVCDHWETVHPQLDPDDGHDAFPRINALARLCEEERLSTYLLNMPLAEVPPHTVVTLADVEISKGHRTGITNVGDPLTAPEIEAAFLSLSLGELRQTYSVCDRAAQAVQKITTFLDEQVGMGAWNSKPLTERIGACTETIRDQLRNRLSVADSVVAQVTGATQPASLDDPATGWASDLVDRSVLSLNKIHVESRDQAGVVLEAVIRYFETTEPSSPVPLMLKRAKRLINQDFVEIIRDLAPEGLNQAQSLTGPGDV